ncbi:hypothetical protein [Proteus mirabilis]|uniref:hypothetical protein n=1 Tax=Proteus mirabilis TaxID=584 RepID=UPI0031B7AD92
MDKSRQQFEEEFRKHSTLDEVDIFKIDSESDDYYYLATRWAWRWWQASRESLEVEFPEPFIANENCETWCYDEDLVNQVLISNGIKIKNG